MAAITIPGMFLTGDHASRPAANAVGKGALYSCTDHDLIYQSDGSTWTTWATLGGSGTPSGTELDYAEATAPVSITNTVEASADTLVTGASQAYAAVPTMFEFFCPNIDPQNTANAFVTLYLFDGATSLGYIGWVRQETTANLFVPVTCKRRLTPTAATHQYSVRATTSSGTGAATAGAGGAGAYVPMYLRITTA